QTLRRTMCHKIVSLLALLEVNDINGLDLITHIVAKRIALEGHDRRDFNRIQLLAKWRHTDTAVHNTIDMCGERARGNFTTDDSREDSRHTFAVRQMAGCAILLINGFALLVELLEGQCLF